MIYLFENINNDASIIYKTRAVQVEELPYQEIPQGKYAVLKCKKKQLMMCGGSIWIIPRLN